MNEKAVELMREIIHQNIPHNIWVGSPLTEWSRLGATNKGEAGEQFIRRYLTAKGIYVGNGTRVSPYDMTIGNARDKVEVKTAGLGANGGFQFNHVRLDKDYRWLILLGVCPDDVLFDYYEKTQVLDGSAGSLVNMAEGQEVTAKIAKPQDTLRPIAQLVEWAKTL